MDMSELLRGEAGRQRDLAHQAWRTLDPDAVHVALAEALERLADAARDLPTADVSGLRDDLAARFEASVAAAAEKVSADAGRKIDAFLASARTAITPPASASRPSRAPRPSGKADGRSSPPG